MSLLSSWLLPCCIWTLDPLEPFPSDQCVSHLPYQQHCRIQMVSPSPVARNVVDVPLDPFGTSPYHQLSVSCHKILLTETHREQDATE